MPSAHARVGASSLYRTLRCPGSVGLSELAGERDRSKEAASEGTVAHHIRECCLTFGFEPEEFIGDQIAEGGFVFEITDEWAEHLRPGIEWVRERPGDVYIETQVQAGDEMPGQFGTLDVGLIAPDLITINDLKFGIGPVEVYENDQLRAYALWFWENIARHKTDATDFLLVIDQPRVPGGGGEWETTLDELLEFKEELREGFDLIFRPEDRIGDPEDWATNPNAPLNPGEKQCQFCDAAGMCPAYAKFNLDLMSRKFDDLDDVLGDGEIILAGIERFDPARRAFVALNAKAIENWAKAVRAHTLSEALRGIPTPGAKAVPGRRNNKAWDDPEAAEKFLRKRLKKDAIFTPAQLISPTQAEKLIPKDQHEDMAEFWSQSDGRPVLTHEDDPKQGISMADKFED